MKEEDLKRQLQESLTAKCAEAPDFDDVWLAAEAQYFRERRRYKRISAVVAVIAIFAIAISLQLRETTGSPGLTVGEDFLTSTLWTAPSDILIPRHDIDIYQIPALVEPTNLQEGPLL